MKRLWLWLFFLAGVASVAAWVADHPGNVVIRWFGYRIDTSFAFLMFVGLLSAWVFAWVYTLFHDLVRMPKRFRQQRHLRHYEQGLEELTYSVAALAASDNATAELHARKAQKLLGQTPMGLLVAAQIAGSRGDTETKQALLNQMLEYKETKYVAMRLLAGASGTAPSKEYRWGGKLRAFIRT